MKVMGHAGSNIESHLSVMFRIQRAKFRKEVDHNDCTVSGSFCSGLQQALYTYSIIFLLPSQNVSALSESPSIAVPLINLSIE
jgi:hypothetical protein